VVHRRRQGRPWKLDTRSVRRRCRERRERPLALGQRRCDFVHAARQRQNEVQLNIGHGACGGPEDLQAVSSELWIYVS
jgi:hypothetical protein